MSDSSRHYFPTTAASEALTEIHGTGKEGPGEGTAGAETQMPAGSVGQRGRLASAGARRAGRPQHFAPSAAPRAGASPDLPSWSHSEAPSLPNRGSWRADAAGAPTS